MSPQGPPTDLIRHVKGWSLDDTPDVTGLRSPGDLKWEVTQRALRSPAEHTVCVWLSRRLLYTVSSNRMYALWSCCDPWPSCGS